MSPAGAIVQQARAQVLDALRTGERFVLVTHEHPDGDALGSLVGMHGILTALGKDSTMFVGADEFPLPYEYRWFDLEGVRSAVPDDIDERTIVYLDCGTIERNPVEAFRRPEGLTLNIDHHHDNTLFGGVNLVVKEASCTAEIVWDLGRALGVPLTAPIAEALYVGLITDTGRFMYENTGPNAHLMAADLIAAGIDHTAIYRRVYEGWPESKLRLFARALSRAERHAGGALTMTLLSAEDFAQTGAEESYTEGIVDRLRAVEGTKVAALARELLGGDGRWKVSLRSSDGDVDVSVIARAAGGGGHKAAAGLSTGMQPDELVAFLSDQVAAQL
ncbi:MAG TPA: bifunctional oligoribonuclease/PAP phosphatase NrnA [Solirubrobacteraceae bacterium]|nr:bifunctional oligoribonuclease/PAP phosphatase NrnA [Solirubrobacteraceae bacterium]